MQLRHPAKTPSNVAGCEHFMYIMTSTHRHLSYETKISPIGAHLVQLLKVHAGARMQVVHRQANNDISHARSRIAV